MADTHAQHDDEPKTPMWLPALGAVLFLLGGIWWSWSATTASPPGDASGAGGKPAAAAHP